MPAKSQAQRAYLNAKFGHAWVKKHHFDNPGKLPEHVAKHARRKATEHAKRVMRSRKKHRKHGKHHA